MSDTNAGMAESAFYGVAIRYLLKDFQHLIFKNIVRVFSVQSNARCGSRFRE